MRYMLVVVDTMQIIRRGFYSKQRAADWAESWDYGQWENDGGWMIIEYEDTGE